MEDFSQYPLFQEHLSKKNITTPTPVQKQVIPLLQAGSNILFQSETGTGKTLAYLIPLIEKIEVDNNNNNAVQLVISAPTHELASQIKTQVQSICEHKVALLIGGAPLKRQQELLKERPLIVIGGPVRLLELIRLKKLKVDHVKAIVLDEVDRLLAPELRDDTVDLTRAMPADSQLTACSATIKQSIISILEDASNKKIEMVELPPEDVLKRKIAHWAFYSEQRDKIDMLRKLIVAEKPEKTLIFSSRPDQAMNIASKLQYKGIECATLHARADKQSRKQTIDRFRSGKCNILVTSDLAARGLDFPGITHIIQMDVSTNEDFFVHRAGRTARAGMTGINAIIGDGHEMRLLSRLEKRLGIVIYPKELYKGEVVEPFDPSEDNATMVEERPQYPSRRRFENNNSQETRRDSNMPKTRKSYAGSPTSREKNSDFSSNSRRPSDSPRNNNRSSGSPTSRERQPNPNGAKRTRKPY